ncbi:hypothetical protein HHI36_003287 [Cryptolaemus montrouzieri]|uniref:Unconventional myosin-Va n=1 Tax=Cryptolaemus montrouzieri TaxID=559131 RepID=A0ABD2PD63_9CUCU
MEETVNLVSDSGARVWIPHADKVWEPAELKEDYAPSKNTLQVITKAKELKSLTIKNEESLPPLRNPSILVGGNDLTSLSYLHEPAVLHNLQVRFCEQRNIYTYCGIILVAINPYNEVPIYDIDTIRAYRGQTMGDLDPHIFAVAEEAYTKLEREQKDQSIIVSGESGAGKTMSAKYTMRYFATIAVGANASETQVEKKVLASSPIMEAMGNAKTTRNDNSSRFGKFIELHFNKHFHICGASFRTYLLEKSRVVNQSQGERNYHIFYQLCAARQDLPDLHLDDQSEFHYLNHGSLENIDGRDDYESYQETINALRMLGFSAEERDSISGRKIDNQPDREGCLIHERDKHLKILTDLLDIDAENLREWLCTRKIVSARETFLKPMSVLEAQAARDALAKYIYAELFNWIVFILNYGLQADGSKHKFIGVLDIYGFETFETNSFEQFCINYANEKLQQQFNLHVFKLEQEEYITEGIEWKMITFYDNQPCIDLIEAKLGILDLLNEECRMPKGTDGSWTEKLYTKCAKYSHFGKAKFGRSAFTVHHFAAKVEYESDGFLEKNRDTVIEEQINVIKLSKNKLINRLFCTDTQKQLTVPGTKVKITASRPLPASQKIHKKTIGSQFRDSLNSLMTILNSTTPYYIRCIKPNDNKKKFEYNPQRAAQQLRACGVLETIRISAQGFPSRWSYNEFYSRYRVLIKFKDINRTNMQKTCECILKNYIKNEDMYQFGRTKIFFRASQVAYLEKLRGDRLRKCCNILQKTVRAFIARKKFLRIKKSIILIQNYGRGYLGRRLATTIRRERAAVTIGKHVRGWLVRRRYQELRKCVTRIQTYGRGYLARIRYLQLKYNAKAIIIQKYWRSWLARKEIDQRRRHIVVCQAAIRRFLARRQYKKLKIEARSIEHVKALNKGLENKIISLQQKIDLLQKNNNSLEKSNNNHTKEIKELKNKLINFRALEIEIKNLDTLLIEKNKNLDKLEKQLKTERDEKMDLIQQREEILKEKESENQERIKLLQEIENYKELIRNNEKNAEMQLVTRIEEERQLIFQDQDNDRKAYQKILQEYHDLEQHCEELEKQLSVRPGSHQRNNSDLSNIDLPEDFGYGSVRSGSSTSTNRERLDIEGITESRTPPPIIDDSKINSEEIVDIGILLKLQHKLAEVEKEKNRIQKRLDELESSPRVEEAEKAARDSFKLSEYEMQNSTLKAQLIELQNSINENEAYPHLIEQLRLTQDELDRKSDEIIQLKAVLASQTNNMKIIANSKNRLGEYINEDGELALAYETQKMINKQLELELQDEKLKSKTYEREFKLEMEQLREDNNRQQRILAANLSSNPNSQNEIYLQHEVTRLTTENLALHDKCDKLTDTIKKWKRQNQYLIKRLKNAGIELDNTVIEMEMEDKTRKSSNPTTRRISTVKKQDKEYMGMFSFQLGEEGEIMKKLVIQLKPRTAMGLLPCLPAYIVFMCVRYTDYTNNEEKVKNLFSAFSNSVKKVIKKRNDDFETNVLWFANTLRLLNNMKQYSGEKAFQQKNTPRQNEKCLRNFDLSEYRQVLSDIAIWIFQASIRCFTKKVQPLIVQAILEHEEIKGLNRNIPGSGTNNESTPSPRETPTALLEHELNLRYKILHFYGVDHEIIPQIFKQVFYFICSCSVNNLLLRKELCHWSKGIEIRHNLSQIEMWIKDKNLDESCIEVLQPIIQAALLLQARKEDEKDVINICDMCDALTGLQICKLLSLYTPVDEFEKRIPTSFIENVQKELHKRSKPDEPLMMDTKYQYPTRFSFNPSEICLENVEIPEILNLQMLEKM